MHIHKLLPAFLLCATLLRAADPLLPIRIQGAGGDGPKALLAKAGANSFRTWDVDGKTSALLDQAHKLGLKVTLGIWLGHERHGFDYNDLDQVLKQTEHVRKAVLAHKDHPALLAWALGNEMEGPAGENPAIWNHIEALASLVKRLDPSHPTLTVIAEIGGRKIEALHKLCPSLDIVGINSYGGIQSLPQRYRKAGGTKPYIVTEYGPPGTWEVHKNAFGAIPEMTSTQKAAWYGKAFRALHADPLCLGSYAFTWGHKQEGTKTWFGMLLPGNRRLGTVDTLQELWTGKPPANRCPQISQLKTDAPHKAAPGTRLEVRLAATDPENDALRTQWILAEESIDYETGGDFRADPRTFPEAILQSGPDHATVQLPGNGGIYRLYALVTDPHGGAATANLPLFVTGPRKVLPAPKVELPLVLVGHNKASPPHWFPTGWMGNAGALALDEAYAQAPGSGDTHLRIQYKAPDKWGGIVWQHPPSDWGDRPGGHNLSGAKRLNFRAKGERGGETVTFSLGIIGKDKPHHDSAKAELKTTLTAQWQPYAIDLAGKDLSRIKSGFCIVFAGQGRPLAVEVDDLRYE